jgi:tetratricopeptide (TPR) repeat protein
MLRDQGRYAEAVDILQPLVDRIARDGVFRKSIRGRFHADEYKAYLNYYLAMSVRETNLDQARQLFRQVLKVDPDEVDTLIAMHKLPGDANWRYEVETAIRETTDKFEKSIREVDKRNSLGSKDLHTLYNDYAWLVSNTIGDQELALRRAKKASEANPTSAAEADTYARCLFRTGKVAEAIQIQSKAVMLDPNSYQLRRQLEEFKNAVP